MYCPVAQYLLGYTDNRTRQVIGMRHIYVYSIYADKSPTQHCIKASKGG